MEKELFLDKKIDLINNSSELTMYSEISRELQQCESFIFNVAFINFGGLQLLLDDLAQAESRGVKGKILTSTYLNFTEPKALNKIREFKNIESKIFIAERNLGFHCKCFIFKYSGYYKIYVGSSNITQSALKSNIEWNVWIESELNSEFSEKIIKEFATLWNSDNLSNNCEEFIHDYTQHIDGFVKKKPHIGIFKRTEIIKPNYMQEKAIDSLKKSRIHGKKAALVIASTGSGKTYMAAFDVREKNPKSMLFLVHREDILTQSMNSFKNILPHKISDMGILTGTKKDIKDKKYLFATLQSMNNVFETFKPDEFEYIVIDEAHHAASPTYERLLSHFTPEFLLGITATPERGDGQSIIKIFGDNIALDLRLREALEHELVVPFHYYGISDISEVDFTNVSLNDTSKVAKILQINKRVEYIVEKIKFYEHDGDKMKALGFCVSIEHATFMQQEFANLGISSAVLTGSDSSEKRQEIISQLEDDFHPLNIIFTVDIFNEGVDIPSINLVLMLRPTNSPIVFIQQLGRGLRKNPSKEFLTVLDFIGNHNRAFLIALALSGNRYYDKDSIRIAVKNDFSDIPGCVHIKMDKISKERILEQIERENFNALKYLKEEYFEFKKLNGNKIPFLSDFLRFDGAPNPLKYIKFGRTYLGFLDKVEKDFRAVFNCEFGKLEKLLKNIQSFLPLKRVYEFVILKLLTEKDVITLENIQFELSKYLETIHMETLTHSIRVLQWDFMTEKEKTNSSSMPFPILTFNSEVYEVYPTLEFKELLKDNYSNLIIKDSINYGINLYEEIFGTVDYGIPHFKLYETYTQGDTALLSNYEKAHSSFRGSGVLKNGDNYFLFFTLNKPKDIKESINYKNSFYSQSMFQWQTQNATDSRSERGKDLVYNTKRGKNLHIFVRKFTEVDNVIQPFIYLGKGDCLEFYGEKPITLKLKLHNEIPFKIYKEFL